MNQEELKELIYYLSQKDISEFSIEREDLAVRIKRRVEVQNDADASILSTLLPGNAGFAGTGQLPAARADAPVSSNAETKEEQLQMLKSPWVGIFHSSKASNSQPFLSKGEKVKVGQVVGMVDVLRLMHEIHSDFAGEVHEVIVGDREPVEYGQPLFAVRPEKTN
jgi:acetyl-CoA carboxylase biotin carboxyl carrier protein